ncbi:MAG: phosphatidylserine decarboxylase [Methylophilaceae bacterium]|nr:phosphatidylserine decarboxylase [Methylophilaceae bacterium]
MNLSQIYSLIAKEGWPFLLAGFLLALLSSYYQLSVSWIFWVLFFFMLQFFRDPEREVINRENIVTSAADGRVIAIEKTLDPYQKKQSIKVSVFMNVFNVHSNKIPISGEIVDKFYYPGKFVNASLSKASLENERCAIIIKTKDKKIITCVQIAGLIARRILCYAKKKDQVNLGERYGFIRFGSRVDLYLPLNASVKVILGQKVKNVETIIATL